MDGAGSFEKGAYVVRQRTEAHLECVDNGGANTLALALGQTFVTTLSVALSVAEFSASFEEFLRGGHDSGVHGFRTELFCAFDDEELKSPTRASSGPDSIECDQL